MAICDGLTFIIGGHQPKEAVEENPPKTDGYFAEEKHFHPLKNVYVNLEDLINAITASYIKNEHRTDEARRVHNQEHSHLLSLINHINKADVQPIVRGEWIEETFETIIPVEFDMLGKPILHKCTNYKCSICGRTEPRKEPYCHCGAKMKGDVE